MDYQCLHDEWMTICLYCGIVLEDSEHKISVISSTETTTSYIYLDSTTEMEE